MSNPTNQNDALVQYMIDNEYITTWTAQDKLGITSLSRRICDLTEAGYKIDKKPLQAKNRYGNPCRVIAYSLDASLEKIEEVMND